MRLRTALVALGSCGVGLAIVIGPDDDYRVVEVQFFRVSIRARPTRC